MMKVEREMHHSERISPPNRRIFQEDSNSSLRSSTSSSTTQTSTSSSTRKPLSFEDLEPTQQAEVVEKTYAAQLKEMRRPRICVNCKLRFNELENIGQHRCVWHPGRCRLGTWTCCGQVADPIDELMHKSTGCCACDHSENMYNPLKPCIDELPIALALFAGATQSSFRRQESSEKTDLYRKCWIPRTSSVRVQYPKSTRPPGNHIAAPTNEMNELRARLELQEKRTKPEHSFFVNAMVGHFAPMMYT